MQTIDQKILQKLQDIHRALTCPSTCNTTPTEACCTETNELLTQLTLVLAGINTAISNIEVDIDTVNLNTDQLEAYIDTTNNLLIALTNITQTENNETQVELTNVVNGLSDILAKLNETCAGNPINVNVCNQPVTPNYTALLQQIVDNTATSNTNESLILSALLNDVIGAIQAVDTNTDDLETQLAQLILDVQAGNLTAVAIQNILNNDILPQLVAINANTDAVETLIASTNTKLDTLISNTDDVESLLTDIKTVLTAPCGDPNVQKVEVCSLPIDVTYDTFQVTDCEGNNIGTPQDVQKTVILNNIATKICNVDDLASAMTSITVIEKIVTPMDTFGRPLGLVVREVKKYSQSGVLISTLYFDTVTNTPTSLPVGAVQLAEVNGLDKEVIVMCDSGTTFLRHIIYNYGINAFNVLDTELDGITPYSIIGTPTVGQCTIPNQGYNTEEELLLTSGNTYTINSNEVHSYAISVLGNGTASTIQIGSGSVLPITNGYHKQMEFTTLNTQLVNIVCGAGDEIRMILTKI